MNARRLANEIQYSALRGPHRVAGGRTRRCALQVPVIPGGLIRQGRKGSPAPGPEINFIELLRSYDGGAGGLRNSVRGLLRATARTRIEQQFAL